MTMHCSWLVEKKSNSRRTLRDVTPAKAGAYLILCKTRWVPACAGMTEKRLSPSHTFSTHPSIGVPNHLGLTYHRRRIKAVT